MSSKTELRSFYKQKRQSLHSFEIDQYKHLVVTTLIKDKNYLAAKNIGLYSAINNEVDLSLFFQTCLQDKKNCYFPVCQTHDLLFCQATKQTQWLNNKFKIPEPQSNNLITIDQLDYLIIPSIACNKQGFRLGYGSGMYDKTLAQTKKTPYVTTIIYKFQLCDYFKQDNWDMPVKKIYIL